MAIQTQWAARDRGSMAKRIKELTDSDSRIVFVPYEKAYEEGFEDMMRRVPDLTKANQLIGYAPRIQLDQTLGSVIEDVRLRLQSHRTPEAIVT